MRVHGKVEREMGWTLDELSEFPERTVFCTLECAGNGRSFLKPSVPGVQTPNKPDALGLVDDHVRLPQGSAPR